MHAPADTRVMAIEPAGYGVQLIFNDGHARGIYPWAYLAELAATATG
ncbi:gamma-butyrobetaine hydroxylase-like domain-containing protein [Acinetobacter baumannii]